MDEDQLEQNHKHVVDQFQRFLQECSEQGISTDLILHATFCVLFDFALDSAPSKESLFGLIASAMSAAHESNGQQEEDPEGTVH